MSFEKKAEIIKCPYCKNNYNDPRIVDCGVSFCMICIELLTNVDDNGFNCPECKQFHIKPPNGYLQNLSLIRSCILNENHTLSSLIVDNSDNVENLKSALNDIKIKLDKLADDNKLGVVKIKNHCDELRNKVKKHSDELIENIKSLNLKLMENIDDYEKDSMLKFNESNVSCLNEFISETNAYHTKWTNYLKNAKLEDAEIQSATGESNTYLERIKKESETFLNKLFNNNVVVFSKNTIPSKTSVIGKLMIDYSEQFKCLNTYDFCKLNKHTEKSKIIGDLVVKCLNNDGKICIVYRERDSPKYVKNIGIYDRNLKKLINKTITTSNHNYDMVRIAITENDSIFVSMSYNLKTVVKNAPSLILKFDEKLNLMKKINLNYTTLSFESFQNELYILAEEIDNDYTKHVYVYDQDLNEINKFGQSDKTNSPFYIICNAKSLKLTLNYYVLLSDDLLILFMDKINGISAKPYFIHEFYNDEENDEYQKDFFADPKTNNILTYDARHNKLFVYDLDFESVYFTIDLNCMPDNSLKLVDYYNDKLIFYDPTNICFCFSSV